MAVTRSAIKRQKQHADGGGRASHPHHTQLDAVAAHWRELHDPATGRLCACRPPGSPAGTWLHTPWWHCVLHDPYERINFWTHFAPGVLLLLLAALGAGGAVSGGRALAVWGVCSGATHVFSSLGHVYPDSHALEKLDHLGIVATIVGTPLTALMASPLGRAPGQGTAGRNEGGSAERALHASRTHPPRARLLLGAAFMRPLPRVLGFVAGGAAAVALYARQLACATLAAEIALYLAGAAFFLRNGGHARPARLVHPRHAAAMSASAWAGAAQLEIAEAGARAAGFSVRQGDPHPRLPRPQAPRPSLGDTMPNDREEALLGALLKLLGGEAAKERPRGLARYCASEAPPDRMDCASRTAEQREHYSQSAMHETA
eukprot:scaffold26.g3363.t1